MVTMLVRSRTNINKPKQTNNNQTQVSHMNHSFFFNIITTLMIRNNTNMALSLFSQSFMFAMFPGIRKLSAGPSLVYEPEPSFFNQPLSQWNVSSGEDFVSGLGTC
jgi:hypothetical protein